MCSHVSAAAAEPAPPAVSPSPGPAQVIGSAANGCLAGGVALPLSGPGWDVLRPARNRNWGHPDTIAFVERLSLTTQVWGTLLVADIAQPRGGPMVSGHGSHQTGLDVDILFRLGHAPLTEAERSDPDLSGVVRTDGTLDPERWGPQQIAVLKTFASDPGVERIFVAPAIKRALCREIGGDRTWLHTLRPWWGHEEHFHTRLKCPAGDTACINGPPVAAGDGCGADLDWWFTAEAKQPATPSSPTKPAPTKRTRPAMPAACRTLLHR